MKGSADMAETQPSVYSYAHVCNDVFPLHQLRRRFATANSVSIHIVDNFALPDTSPHTHGRQYGGVDLVKRSSHYRAKFVCSL